MERRDPIELQDHDSGWAERFLAEAHAVQCALVGMAAGTVEHIGSTAVPGLPAKPVIDMVIPLYRDASPDAVRSALESIGWVPDPQPDDQAMRRLSFCRPDPARRTHHLHVVDQTSAPWRDWIAFRDRLRIDPRGASAYGELKKELARCHHDHRDAYRAGKSAFVRKTLLAARVHVATADAWERMGRLHEGSGGGVGALCDLRLMASGLPLPSWNNADLTGPAPDLEGAGAFYATRAAPWGVRAPAGAPVERGRWRLTQRMMGLEAGGLLTVPRVPGLELRSAKRADADLVVALDAAGFGEDPRVTRAWTEPHVGAAGFDFVVGELGGESIVTAFTLRSNGWAGPALLLGGVTVMPEARGRGVAGAMSSWLLERGFAGGARLAHLHSDTATAAAVYARLGFDDAGELDVYTEL